MTTISLPMLREQTNALVTQAATEMNSAEKIELIQSASKVYYVVNGRWNASRDEAEKTELLPLHRALYQLLLAESPMAINIFLTFLGKKYYVFVHERTTIKDVKDAAKELFNLQNIPIEKMIIFVGPPSRDYYPDDAQLMTLASFKEYGHDDVRVVLKST